MVGLVRSTVPGALESWTVYYRQFARELLDGTADFAPIHDKAAALVRGSVLDLGSCFGFLPLRLARAGVPVTATDILPGTMTLLDAVAPRLGIPISTLVCDAANVPCPTTAPTTVTAVHLLEHVDARTGADVVAEALRIARERVVVAVPYETRPRRATDTSAPSMPTHCGNSAHRRGGRSTSSTTKRLARPRGLTPRGFVRASRMLPISGSRKRRITIAR